MKIKIIILTIFAMFAFSKTYAQLDTAFISVTKSICIDSIKTVSDIWRYGNELSKYKKTITNKSRYTKPAHEEVSKQPPRGYIYEMWRIAPTPIDKNENYLLEGLLNEVLPALLFK
ncbi:MAG: hypothetical protein LBQ28_07245 [Prevotellaceae bacterium]|nr:hypothetical protein [Prevotellaceae bacterium]